MLVISDYYMLVIYNCIDINNKWFYISNFWLWIINAWMYINNLYCMYVINDSTLVICDCIFVNYRLHILVSYYYILVKCVSKLVMCDCILLTYDRVLLSCR